MSLPTLLAIGGAALAIAIGLLFYLRGRHPFFRVPFWRVLLFFLYGAICAPLLLVIPYLLLFFAGVNAETALGAFLFIGPLEEVAKVAGPLVLVGLVRAWRDEPFEWMLACAAAGTGFAMTENVLYALVFSEEAFQVLALRSVAPMHLIWSAIIGYRVGCRKPGAGGFMWAMLVGFVIAAFLHGFWDALCFTGYVGLLLVLFGGQLAGFGWQIRKMSWLCANRSLRRPDAAVEAGSAPSRPSAAISCAGCKAPFGAITLRGVELSSCPACARATVGRADLFRLICEYAGANGWFALEDWYRFYWQEGQGAIPCATCGQPAPVRKFLDLDEPKVGFCSDCATATADRGAILELVPLFRRRLETGFTS